MGRSGWRWAAGRGGFTLIEVVAVLVIVGLVVGMVGVASGYERVGVRQRRAVEETAELLGLARAEAMQGSRRRVVEIAVEGERLVASYGARVRSFGETGLVIAGRGRTVEETGRVEVGRVEVAFDGLGRTRERVIVLDGREAGGTMWVLRFDPVSGAVSAGALEAG